MNTLPKIILTTVALISMASCKNDKSVVIEEEKVRVEEERKGDSIALAKKMDDSLALVQKLEEEKLLAEEEERKAKKKTTFNPPHIAVLESEYEGFEAKKPKKKAAVSTAKPAKKIEKQKATKPGVKETATEQLTEMVFKRNFYSFGEITQGDTIYFEYQFTNIGEAPLIIKDATATCGCTHPSFPFTPIAPGDTGEITGMYISTTKKGPQNAMVKIVANTEPAVHKLMLDGTVLLPESTEEAKVEDQ